MSTKQSTVDYIIDQLAELRNVRARKMFGEYALYCDDKVVALICDDQLFIKKTETGVNMMIGRYEEAPAYPGARLSMLINEDVLDDRELLSRLIRATADSLLPPKPKKKKRGRI
jgi:DNA transformation protein